MKQKVLIAYALNDRQPVSDYIIKPLQEEGITVWDYNRDIKLGDSMILSIRKALVEADYGLVVLSPNLIEEKWSVEIFKSLFSLDAASHKKLLPVWYGIDYQSVLEQYPHMLDRKAVLARHGWKEVIRQLMAAIFEKEPSEKVLASLPDKEILEERAWGNFMNAQFHAEGDLKIINAEKIDTQGGNINM